MGAKARGLLGITACTLLMSLGACAQPKTQDGGPTTQAAAAPAWAVLNSDNPVPEFLEPAATATLEADGARTRSRTYLRTRRGDYLDRDFTFDVVFVNDRNPGIMFVGLGEGVGAGPYKEPGNSVMMRIHAPGYAEGFVGVGKQPFDNKKIGYMTVEGTHLARIQKRGDRVTLAIDHEYDGEYAEDMSITIADIRAFAPNLTSTNTHLFFGSGGLYQRVRITEGNAD